ncbi:MAG: hypothetical protein HKN19_17205 [Halioglobus sp.]|nr:hypothetical protein [Halioglobus sp.]
MTERPVTAAAVSYPQVDGPDPTADATLAALLEKLCAERNNAVCAMLVYGSCLRSGDIYDGLLDLYVVLDNYRDAYRGALPALANWLLPPNVYYAEQAGATQGAPTLRAKVTVISLADFRRGCSTRWFESYIWGRFAQPTQILYARDPAARATMEDALSNAVATLLDRALPALPAAGSLEALWEGALGLSYATELRTERGGRAQELAEYARDFYAEVSRAQAGRLAFPFDLHEDANGTRYTSDPGGTRRTLARLSWGLRRVQGKLLSIARLVKALFTFAGGLDYIAWKLERHSGEKIEIPERVRAAPLLHLWGFFWGLYKRGIFK